MKKFEYKIEDSAMDYLQSDLESLGKEGWELAACFPVGTIIRCIFKREISE